MKKNFFIGILFVSLLLYSNGLFDNFDKKKKMIEDSLSKKYGIEKSKILTKIYDALKIYGLPVNTIKLALAQVMHETGVFSDKQKASKVNNFSGIVYSGSADQIKNGAIRSNIALPKREQNGKTTIYYAQFPSVLNWSKEYLRILSKGVKPIQAISPDDFAIRLKKNNYYTDSVENYKKNINFYYNFLTNSGI